MPPPGSGEAAGLGRVFLRVEGEVVCEVVGSRSLVGSWLLDYQQMVCRGAQKTQLLGSQVLSNYNKNT